MDYLDTDEKELIDSYENDEWVSAGEKIKEKIKEAAKNSDQK